MLDLSRLPLPCGSPTVVSVLDTLTHPEAVTTHKSALEAYYSSVYTELARLGAVWLSKVERQTLLKKFFNL